MGDAKALIWDHFGINIHDKSVDDYDHLLAAVHDCAEYILSQPDDQPVPDRKRFPRLNVHRITAAEQDFGSAWVYKFLIPGGTDGRRTLKGKLICLKDCIAVADIPQYFGSDAFPAWTPSTDAVVVTRLLEAGADIVGTCTCESFCNSTSSFMSAQGVVENPHREGYSAGGSTSGCATLVASGLVDCAVGTDQGGSIRVPSSFCGCQ